MLMIGGWGVIPSYTPGNRCQSVTGEARRRKMCLRERAALQQLLYTLEYDPWLEAVKILMHPRPIPADTFAGV
jgi:hypothetical protein